MGHEVIFFQAALFHGCEGHTFHSLLYIPFVILQPPHKTNSNWWSMEISSPPMARGHQLRDERERQPAHPLAEGPGRA